MVRQLPTSQPQQSSAQKGHFPPLENGDRLSCPEFERRYAAMPYIKKTELIEGIVYVASPNCMRQLSLSNRFPLSVCGLEVAMLKSHEAIPKSGQIAVRVINHLSDEVMKVFSVE